MQIEKVEPIVLESNVDSTALPAESGAFDVEISSVLVKVHTDEGITGIGETFHRTVAENKHLAQSIETLGQDLVGSDPREVTHHWDQLYDLHVKRSGAFEALSALDEALWDIVGKHAGVPVYQLLGGKAGEVQTYATFPHQKPADELAEDAAWLADSGFESMKIATGLGVATDKRRIETVAEALPDGFGLSIDANTTYDLTDALAVARTASEHELEWFEEPMPHTDTRGYAELRDQVSVPIAAYQTHNPHYPAVDLLREGSLDIYQPSLDHGGGITAANRVATLVEAFNKRLVPHAFGPVVNYCASVHVAVASPSCSLIEFAVLDDAVEDPTSFIASPYVENQNDLDVNDGTITPPDKPGLGLTLDEDAVEEFRVE